jgi:hypothetical protein
VARRKYGWALRGHPAFVKRFGINGLGEGFSSIASFSLNGIDTVTTFDRNIHGNIGGDEFLHTLEYIIFPTMNIYDEGPRCVLGLDNSRTHQKDEIYALAAQFGIKVHFLPTYSYDMNPIELCFHLAKAHIKKNYHNERIIPLITQFTISLYECCDRKKAAALFRKCYIPVEDE